MDELIKKIFDKHEIHYADVTFDEPPYFANYIDDSYDSVKEAIIEIVAVKVAQSIIEINKTKFERN